MTRSTTSMVSGYAKCFKRPAFCGIFLTAVILGCIMPVLIVTAGVSGLQLAPQKHMITMPAGIQMVGGVVSAAFIAQLMARLGRTFVCILFCCVVVLSGLCGYVAFENEDFVWICVAHLFLGASLTAFNFLRFAAAESVDDASSAFAISLIVFGGLFSAFVGPTLAGYAIDPRTSFNLSDAYLMVSALGFLGAVPVFLVWRRGHIVEFVDKRPSAKAENSSYLLSSAPVTQTGSSAFIAAACIGAAVMVFMMSGTPSGMTHSGHDVLFSVDVVRWHIIAMFAPSLLTGFLGDRYGAYRLVIMGLSVCACAGLVAMISTTNSSFYIALILVGVGWNFAFIASSKYLAELKNARQKSGLLGLSETLIPLSSAFAAATSGAVIVQFGWSAVGTVSLLMSLAALCFCYFIRPNVELGRG